MDVLVFSPIYRVKLYAVVKVLAPVRAQFIIPIIDGSGQKSGPYSDLCELAFRAAHF